MVEAGIRVIQGDITQLRVDAIVNAANEHLRHGGGVAAAIVAAGGPVIQEESIAWIAEHGPLDPGVAAVTSAGSLPADYVIHVAGPRFREGQDNASLLAAAVRAALDGAAEVGARTVALPAISAGIFGFPLAAATGIIAHTSRDWIGANPGTLDRILLVGFDQETVNAFEDALV